MRPVLPVRLGALTTICILSIILTGMEKHGRFIAIEGLDGSGKSTQIRMLSEYLTGRGIPTKFVHFPRHGEGVYGKMISKFLRGGFGTVGAVHPQLVALMFAMDRRAFAPTIREWLSEGYCVLVDRYVLSNIAYQCAKTPDEAEKQELQSWILDLEYHVNAIPQPDVNFFLRVPEAFNLRALAARRQAAARDYLDGGEDIHERDLNLQRAVAREYHRMSASDMRITAIDCSTASGDMKLEAAIHTLILEAAGV